MQYIFLQYLCQYKKYNYLKLFIFLSLKILYISQKILFKKRNLFLIHFIFRGNYMKNNQKSLINQEQQSVKPMPDSGRSMVEMLGTLAIMGVLAIGGIMGYSYAMKKYRSNQIANELSVLSNQIFLTMSMPHHGEYELSLGSPYDEGTFTASDYTFGFGCGSDSTVDIPCSADESAYYMSIENIPADLCPTLAQTTQHLSNLVEQQVNGSVDVTGTNCISSETGNALTLFFETEKGENSTDNNDDTAAPTPTACESNSECPELCDTTSNTCKTCSEINAATPKWNGTSCVTCAEDSVNTPIWNGSSCVACPTEAQKWDTDKKECVPVECPENKPYYHNTSETCVACYENAHCDKNDGKTYYCFATSSNLYEEIINSSECKEATILTPKEGTSSDWTLSNDPMNWWSAKRFCQAINKPTMLSVGDLNCKDKNIGKESSNGGTTGVCYDADVTDNDVISPVVEELYNAYGSYYGWTSNSYNSGLTYVVYFLYRNVNLYDKYQFYYRYSAVCK